MSNFLKNIGDAISKVWYILIEKKNDAINNSDYSVSSEMNPKSTNPFKKPISDHTSKSQTSVKRSDVSNESHSNRIKCYKCKTNKELPFQVCKLHSYCQECMNSSSIIKINQDCIDCMEIIHPSENISKPMSGRMYPKELKDDKKDENFDIKVPKPNPVFHTKIKEETKNPKVHNNSISEENYYILPSLSEKEKIQNRPKLEMNESHPKEKSKNPELFCNTKNEINKRPEVQKTQEYINFNQNLKNSEFLYPNNNDLINRYPRKQENFITKTSETRNLNYFINKNTQEIKVNPVTPVNTGIEKKRFVESNINLFDSSQFSCTTCSMNVKVIGMICNHNICLRCISIYGFNEILDFERKIQSRTAENERFCYHCPLKECNMILSFPTVMILNYIASSGIARDYGVSDDCIRYMWQKIPFYDGLTF